MKKAKIVVCGATGNQGGAVAAKLLESGRWSVTALTRNLGSAASLALASMGADVVNADLHNIRSLLDAFSGAEGVFGVTQPWLYHSARFDTDAELRQAKNITWACRDAGIKEVIFSTVLNVNNGICGVSWIDSKRKIEKLLRDNLPDAVIIRPSLFVENIGTALMRIDRDRIQGRFDEDRKVPYISLEDIGECVAKVFYEPSPYRGKVLNLPGQLLAGRQIADLFSSLAVCYGDVDHPVPGQIDHRVS